MEGGLAVRRLSVVLAVSAGVFFAVDWAVNDAALSHDILLAVQAAGRDVSAAIDSRVAYLFGG